MKRPLCLTLCIVCIAALLLGGAFALHHHLRISKALAPYPARQVETAKEYIAIMEEVEDILTHHGLSDAEKAAELKALHPP